MSQWTHILGIIRYDSMVKNMWPEPHNKDEILSIEMEAVSRSYQTALPTGSEGSLQVNFKLTQRGPTVLVTGDLRDFGKENLAQILAWIRTSNESVTSALKTTGNVLFIRDMFINCEVEYDENMYVIEMDKDELSNITINKYKPA